MSGISKNDLERRIKYHRPDQDGLDRIAQMRRLALDFGNGIRQMCPPGHEQDQAIANLEQTLFWANAGIARDPEHRADK